MGSRPLLRDGRHTVLSPAKLKEYLTLSMFIISLATGTLINLFFIRSAKEHLSKNPSLIAACASSFMSLISGFGLAIDTMKQMTTSSSAPRPYSWPSKFFLSLSIASITFTVISVIVSFLPKTYYYLPAVLMPAFLVLGVSFYDGHRQRRNLVGDDDADNNDERERSFQLAVNMTGFSFAGALGTIIGYHKNYSNRANHVYVSVSIYFMLGASITGLLVMFLSRLRRIDWKKAAVGNAVMLCLLVPGALIVATTFLGGLLAGTLFPSAVAAGIWYFFEYHVPRGRGDLDAAFSREEELKVLYSGALTAISVSFGALMTTFAGFLGGQPKGCSLEVFMFFVVSCFVSSVTLGVITFWTPKKASLGAAARALACISLVLFVLAGLAMVSYVG